MILLLAYFGCKKVDSDPALLSNTGNKNNDYLLVNAGMAQAIALPANFVTLSGIATDSGSLIASYTWSQISGPDTALVVSASNLQTLVAGLKAGVYVFQLTVRDTSKLADSSRVTVTVNSSASKVLQTWKLLASKDTSATWDSVNYSLVSFSYSYYCIKGPVGSPVAGRQVLSPFSCSYPAANIIYALDSCISGSDVFLVDSVWMKNLASNIKLNIDGSFETENSTQYSRRVNWENSSCSNIIYYPSVISDYGYTGTWSIDSAKSIFTLNYTQVYGFYSFFGNASVNSDPNLPRTEQWKIIYNTDSTIILNNCLSCPQNSGMRTLYKII